MGFAHDHTFVAAVSTVGIDVLSSVTPYGVPDDPPESHILEDGLNMWGRQLRACGSISTPRELAGFTAGTRSPMNATHHTVMSRPESPAAAHLTGQMARYQAETHLCILEQKTLAGAAP